MKNILFLLLLLFLSGTKGSAQNNLPLLYEIKNDTASQFLDNSYYQVLEDKAQKWTVDDVIASALQNKFHSRTVIVKGVDTIANTYWFRYRLKNVINKEIKIFLNTSGDMVDYYVFEETKRPKHFISGEDVVWSKKDGYKEMNTVPVTLLPAEEVAVYCRTHNV